MVEKDTKEIDLGEIKSLTLLADAKNIYSFAAKPKAKVTVKIEITQTT